MGPCKATGGCSRVPGDGFGDSQAPSADSSKTQSPQSPSQAKMRVKDHGACLENSLMQSLLKMRRQRHVKTEWQKQSERMKDKDTVEIEGSVTKLAGAEEGMIS